MTTPIREANVSEKVTPPTIEMLYCISCGRMVKAEASVCGMGHVTTDNDGEVDFCCFNGGYAFCPPPDIAEDEQQENENQDILEWLGVE